MTAFITDLVALFTPVATEIAGRRLALGLPPLVAPSPPTAAMVGSLLIGQEWIRRQHSPPRIVIVPTGARYEATRRVGVQPMSGRVEGLQPKIREMRWLQFDAHLWGDPDLTSANGLQDFNACIELEAELLTALYDQCGGTPNVRHGVARFEQPTDDARMGRVMVLPFEIGTNVTDLPYTILPYATDSASGVTVLTEMSTVFADGTSSVAGVIVAPPP
jgi:hypothetical protein